MTRLRIYQNGQDSGYAAGIDLSGSYGSLFRRLNEKFPEQEVNLFRKNGDHLAQVAEDAYIERVRGSRI